MLIIVISTPPVHYDDYDDNYEMVDVISSFSERVLYYVVLKRSEGTPKRSAGRLRLKGCLHYDTCTPYMYAVQVYGVHVS